MAQVIFLVAAVLSGIFVIIFFYHWRKWSMSPLVATTAQVVHLVVVVGLLALAAGLMLYV